MDEDVQHSSHQKLTGIGGWLAFFVFLMYLTLIGDAIALILIFSFHGALTDGGLSLITFLGSVCYLVVDAAVQFWFLRIIRSRSRHAIEQVRIYLGAQVILGFISNPLGSAFSDAITVNGVKLSDRSSAATPLWWSVLSAFIVPGLWYFYFQRSRRVHLTFTR